MEQLICPYFNRWNFEEVDTPICAVNNYLASCDGRNYTDCPKFIENRKQFDSY